MIYVIVFNFFFFKQKTAYEMRISDWSSDVCSSDLARRRHRRRDRATRLERPRRGRRRRAAVGEHVVDAALDHASNRRRRAAHSRTDTRADLESAGQYLSHAEWPLRQIGRAHV